MHCASLLLGVYQCVMKTSTRFYEKMSDLLTHRGLPSQATSCKTNWALGAEPPESVPKEIHKNSLDGLETKIQADAFTFSRKLITVFKHMLDK